MAEVVTAEVTHSVKVNSTTTFVSGAAAKVAVQLPYLNTSTQFANGTTAGQVSKKWVDTRTLAISTPVSLDLTALAGAATNTGDESFSKVKVLGIYNNEAANSGKDLTVFNSGANDFTGPLAGTGVELTVKAGSAVVFDDQSTAGMAVDSSHKVVYLDPGASAISVTVVIAGN